MAFTLWDFLLSSLLFVNSVAILNEERFLSRSIHINSSAFNNYVVVGWGKAQLEQASGYGDQSPTVKRQIIQLMAAVRTLLRST